MKLTNGPFLGRRQLADGLRAGWHHGRVRRTTCVAPLLASLWGLLVAGSASATDTQVFKTETERLSYALGMTYGDNVRKAAFEFDAASFIQGLKDGHAGAKTALSEGEARTLVQNLQDEQKRKALTKQAEQLYAENAQADKNRQEGEAFLAANKSKESVVTLPSGLQYKILKVGNGPKATLEDTVVCHFKGSTIDGKEFNNTFEPDKPGAIPVKATIKAWSEALQLMPVGSKWQLFVPPHLAYGARAAKNAFGPNSTLIFELELLSIQDKSTPEGKTKELSKAR